jgi:hypothetical protein
MGLLGSTMTRQSRCVLPVAVRAVGALAPLTALTSREVPPTMSRELVVAVRRSWPRT